MDICKLCSDNAFIILRDKEIKTEERNLLEIHNCDEYICQLGAAVMNFREDEKGFPGSKKLVT